MQLSMPIPSRVYGRSYRFFYAPTYKRRMVHMTDSLAEHYLENVVAEFRGLKRLADRAIEQLNDEEFFRAIDPESNSVALIMKHLAGNMRSRWTDILTTDGEKPDRRRDSEFLIEGEDRRVITDKWEA